MTREIYDLMFRILGHSRAPAERWVREAGLTMAQARTIGYIEANQDRGVTARELAEISGTTAASVSSLLAGLERAGYIERIPDPGDARSKLLRVLPAGRGLTVGYDELMDRFREYMVAPLSAKDRATLVRLLHTIDDHLTRGEEDTK
jgi:DNA-binding MarR family transcriptional regulator